MSRDPVPPGLTRRAFLTGAAGTGLVAAAGLAVPRMAWAARPHVAVVTGDPGPAVRAAVDLLGGMGAFVRSGQRVVIKPNMSFPNPSEAGGTTNTAVTREVVRMCREAGAREVLVLDNPVPEPNSCLRFTRDAMKEFGTEMVYAPRQASFYRTVPVQGTWMKETAVMTKVLDADVLITIPNAHTHNMTGVSLALKGMMGLIWDRLVMHSKYDLSGSIVDLCTRVVPHLVLVDGIHVLTTNGPAGPGIVVQKNTIIASRDPVAADAQTVREFQWYGRPLDPRNVRHIVLAHERGLGRMDVENLVVQRKVL